MQRTGARLIIGLFSLLLISATSLSSVAVYDGVFSGSGETVQETKCDVTSQNKTSKEKGLQSNSWRGLVPLSSTRANVEHLLGKGKPHLNGFSFIYENETDRVDVLYSAGACKLSGVERWNAPKDVVIRMDVAPRRSILVQDLGLDPKKYVRIQLSHPSHWFQYRNEEAGIVVHTIASGEAEELYIMSYEPRANDKLRRCQDP